MNPDDTALVAQLHKKKEQALFIVIDRYGGLIRSIIRHHLTDHSAHDECMDDVLMSIWMRIDCYDERKNTLASWIAAVTKYKAIDYQRSYARRANRLIYGSPELERIAAVDVYDDEEEWQGLLGHLGEKDRELFVQHYIRDRSVHELAEARGVKHSWIYNRLSRGRKKLRTLLHSLRNG